MQLPMNSEIAEISIELNELKSQFDQFMRQGENFSQLKKIYVQIKNLECRMNALQWAPLHSEKLRGEYQDSLQNDTLPPQQAGTR